MRNVIYYIAKQYKKTNKQKYKTYNERKYRLYQFLNNIFKEDREEFLNTIQDKLQRGRIKYQLENYYDDTYILMNHINKESKRLFYMVGIIMK